MNEEIKTNQITLTAEQLVNIVGHAATQEQLDNVRRELSSDIKALDKKIERVQSDFDSKLNKIEDKLDSKIDKLDSRIDKLDAKIDTNLKWIIGMWLTTLVSIALAVMKLMPH